MKITATDSSVSPSVSGNANLTQSPRPAACCPLPLSPASIIANGSSTTTATATVTNASGEPVTGANVGFSSTASGEKIGAVTNHGNGTYTATITSGIWVGTVKITATDSSVSPSVSGNANLTQAAG